MHTALGTAQHRPRAATRSCSCNCIHPNVFPHYIRYSWHPSCRHHDDISSLKVALNSILAPWGGFVARSTSPASKHTVYFELNEADHPLLERRRRDPSAPSFLKGEHWSRSSRDPWRCLPAFLITNTSDIRSHACSP